MNKKTIFLMSLAILAGNAIFAMAPKPNPLTAIIMPRHFTGIEIAMDTIARHNAVLLSYQPTKDLPETPTIHAWNGKKWIFVENQDFAAASFIKITPQRTIIFGEDEALVEHLISDASLWCPQVRSEQDLTVAGIVNALGYAFDFTPSEWKWYAKRYNLDLEDLNQERRATSWYDQPYSESTGANSSELLTLPQD